MKLGEHPFVVIVITTNHEKIYRKHMPLHFGSLWLLSLSLPPSLYRSLFLQPPKRATHFWRRWCQALDHEAFFANVILLSKGKNSKKFWVQIHCQLRYLVCDPVLSNGQLWKSVDAQMFKSKMDFGLGISTTFQPSANVHKDLHGIEHWVTSTLHVRKMDNILTFFFSYFVT